MNIGGRQYRQSKRPGAPRTPYEPHMPVLARIIMNSGMFRRLMEGFDTREGVKQENTSTLHEPGPSRPSDRLLPEKGPFVPRMHPLGGMVLRTRFVQRLLANPASADLAISPGRDDAASGTGRGDGEAEEDRQSGYSNTTQPQGEKASPQLSTDSVLSEAEIRELRQKALISSLLRSATRWGAR